MILPAVFVETYINISEVVPNTFASGRCSPALLCNNSNSGKTLASRYRLEWFRAAAANVRVPYSLNENPIIMDRSERRKQKKAKDRSGRLKKEHEVVKQLNATAKKRSQYPEIVIRGSGVRHAEFFDCLRSAVGQVDFTDSSKFSSIERQYYKAIKEHGAAIANDLLDAFLNSMDGEKKSLRASVFSRIVNNLGEVIFEQIPLDIRQRSLPFANCQLVPNGISIVLEYEELESFPTSGAKIYSSRLKPTIRFHGMDYRVGFFDHALKQICSRMKEEHISYASSGDLFGFFAKCVYFEPTVLYPDQPAFLMWDYAWLPGVRQYDVYVKEVLGEKNINWSGGIPYYRLGYCPVAFENGFAVAKTFLTPGYKNTPEFGLLIRDRQLSIERKNTLIALTEKSTSLDVIKTQTIEHISWFHHNGLPQVVQMERQVFQYSNRPKVMIKDIEELRIRKMELIEQGII